jgi:tripartite-type tricarboxylate transporter receptor subunit TctC
MIDPRAKNGKARAMSRYLKLSLVAGLIVLSGSLMPAGAQESFPSRLVRVIVPFPPGSTLDVFTRLVTDLMAQKWGQPVVIENISGGGGNVGTERFVRSAPDGYTLVFAPPGPFTINPLLYGDAAPDPTKFTAISVMARVPNVLTTRNGLANSVQDLIALAKANPGKLTYASQGVGSTSFLTSKFFETRAGIEMVHVPYRGAGPALSDIVAGHVDMMFDNIVTSLPLHKAGKARILAIANTERSNAIPDIPTIAEAGLPAFRSVAFFACAAPPNTPPAIADQISRDLAEIVHRPAVVATLHGLLIDPVGTTPAETEQIFRDETAIWGKVIVDTGAKLQ